MPISLYSGIVFSVFVLLLINQQVWAQPSNPREFVTYEKQSNFIREFEVPFDELGIRGIATDSGGNVWFYHSTNMTSTLVSFDPVRNEFTEFPVEGRTVADNAIINLASAQLLFDEDRNAQYFPTSVCHVQSVRLGSDDSIKNSPVGLFPINRSNGAY